jgi:hypothetical protein
MSHPTLSKDSLKLLQDLDCNCNDCKFMVRDAEKFRAAQERRKSFMREHFETLKRKEIETLEFKERMAAVKRPERLASLIALVESRVFEYGAPHPQINYGTCTNPESGFVEVDFLPTTFSGDTQRCFVNRRD